MNRSLPLHTPTDPAGVHVGAKEAGAPQPALLFSSHEQTDQLFKLMLSNQQETRRQSRKLFDYSNPVDEWSTLTAAAAANFFTDIQRDYDLPERYTSIFYSLPPGLTLVTLQLGQRFITLYSGAALATQLVNSLPGLGIIVGPDERRTLTFTGTPTAGHAVGLMGHCLEREGNR